MVNTSSTELITTYTVIGHCHFSNMLYGFLAVMKRAATPTVITQYIQVYTGSHTSFFTAISPSAVLST